MDDSFRVLGRAGRASLLAAVFLALASGGVAAQLGDSAALRLEDLPGLMLRDEDFSGELSGFSTFETRAVPNGVKANTGGGGTPVTVDDPEYGDELARLDGLGRLGGHEVSFVRPAEPGAPRAVTVDLDLAGTDAGAHALYLDWYASEPNDCLALADESDCPFGVSILLQRADGTEEQVVWRTATFRSGRVIGSVTVETTAAPDDEPGPQLEAAASGLARLLFERVQQGVAELPARTAAASSPPVPAATSTPSVTPDASLPATPPGVTETEASDGRSSGPGMLEPRFLEDLCQANAPDRRTRRTCLDIVRTVLLPAGAIAIPPGDADLVEPGEDHPGLGDEAGIGATQRTSMLRITLLGVDWEPDGMFPSPGSSWVGAEFDIQGLDPAAWLNAAGFTAVDEDGYVYDATCGQTCMVGGELPEGRKKRGWLFFQVPDDAAGLDIEYADLGGVERLAWSVVRSVQ